MLFPMAKEIYNRPKCYTVLSQVVVRYRIREQPRYAVARTYRTLGSDIPFPLMQLRFQSRSPAKRPSMLGGAGLRLVSLAMGLGLVIMLMQIARSPGTIEKLGLLFGNSSPSPPPTNTDRPEAALPTVDPGLLVTVEDNTTFRDEETDAWFHLLAVARNANDKQLVDASLGELAYAQLVNQPTCYRGQVVRIDGNIRRVESITPATNDEGIDQLYRIIIQPSHDVLQPFTLYCLELPLGWVAGDSPPNEGRMTTEALFFKNWLYNHQRGVDLSPVFVSRTFSPIVESVRLVDRTPALPAWQTAVLAAIVAAVVVGWIVMHNVDSPRRRYSNEGSEVASELHNLTAEQDAP